MPIAFYTEPMQHPTAGQPLNRHWSNCLTPFTMHQRSFAGPLARFAGGNETEAQAVVDELTPQIYAALKRVARAQLRHERADHTLQSTALVNEAYARMCEGNRPVAARPQPFLSPRCPNHASCAG